MFSPRAMRVAATTLAATLVLAACANTDRAEELAKSVEEKAGVLAQDPVRQTALSTVNDLPDPPAGQITVQLRIRYQGEPLPGEGITFHETVPETDGLFTMKSLPPGEPVPMGDRIEDGIVFVTPGDTLKTELVFQNPSDTDVAFVAVPWYAEPAALHLGITNQCFCASVPWFAPAGGSWYRTIYTGFDAGMPVGSKMAIVWTVVTDPSQWALLPGETVDSAIQQFNNLPGAATASPTPAATETQPPAGVTTLEIVGKDIAFNVGSLKVAADTPFEVAFDNQDEGIPHNFAIYKDAPGQGLIAKTEIETGPVMQTLGVDGLPAGTYFYQCDVHPATMTGALRVK